eukprot:TRINITY_DN38460_c0_g1_i1.p1 TRINITY_DN38460_c0_g1~~TRINITY_DN38460_c0_g1_i1.p1  ORF type:complete len:372 (-),score=98.88 TRINITY_DN38460_c0_g1_i1:178-1293(-)
MTLPRSMASLGEEAVHNGVDASSGLQHAGPFGGESYLDSSWTHHKEIDGVQGELYDPEAGLEAHAAEPVENGCDVTNSSTIMAELLEMRQIGEGPGDGDADSGDLSDMANLLGALKAAGGQGADGYGTYLADGYGAHLDDARHLDDADRLGASMRACLPDELQEDCRQPLPSGDVHLDPDAMVKALNHTDALGNDEKSSLVQSLEEEVRNRLARLDDRHNMARHEWQEEMRQKNLRLQQLEERVEDLDKDKDVGFDELEELQDVQERARLEWADERRQQMARIAELEGFLAAAERPAVAQGMSPLGVRAGTSESEERLLDLASSMPPSTDACVRLASALTERLQQMKQQVECQGEALHAVRQQLAAVRSAP